MIVVGMLRDMIAMILATGVLIVVFGVAPATIQPYILPALILDFALRIITA